MNIFHKRMNGIFKSFSKERLRELLRGISNVKSLRLPRLSLMELIPVDGDGNHCFGATVFMNATFLELGVYCISRMLSVLAKMPNLVHLKLSSYRGQFLYAIPVSERNVVPSCVPPNLKVIEVDLDDLCDDNLDLLTYFVDNAVLLEKMSIQINNTSSFSSAEFKDFNERLLMCPPASETCQIEFLF